jgi:hypothetical protein
MVLEEVEEPDKEEEPDNYHAWKFNNSFTWQVLCKAIEEIQMVYCICPDPTLPQRCGKLCA